MDSKDKKKKVKKELKKEEKKDTKETKKTDKAILISKDKARVTPSNAEWDKVSPKKDSLLQITKHPRGPATKAMPMPAIRALIKKSSNIINVSFL